ncbi:phosphate ABC transporter permease PstA [Ureibacillus thermophilus]|uniref:Phosphate transport system permease protein PstA n=1 Tax=Ureibacillus thermophilus TaxID=367743 RepID=A0A4P6USW3_9BACL|nr:phosphate ABC transporter permease PstA [Ureibacillus thermophilus]QBK26243.1 phosphate ABC transporter permease PstA [Ureibacillus thermophilus]
MTKYIDDALVMKRIKTRLRRNQMGKGIFFLAAVFALFILVVLIARMIFQGLGYFDWDFLNNFSSRFPEKAGVKAALVGSVYMMLVVIPTSLIIGVATAIYLEEYARNNRWNNFIRANISNLAGVPSIVFGLLGLTIFVRLFGFGKSILAAGLTMSLLILPVIIVAAQEAIRAVPKEMREASYAMGATKWQTIMHVVLPASVPGILTGSILAFSRAIGETAPLVVIGIPVIVHFLPNGLLSEFTALPLQIYDWAKRPQEEFQNVAASGILVLMIVLILMNSIAVFIRNKFQKRY